MQMENWVGKADRPESVDRKKDWKRRTRCVKDLQQWGECNGSIMNFVWREQQELMSQAWWGEKWDSRENGTNCRTGTKVQRCYSPTENESAVQSWDLGQGRATGLSTGNSEAMCHQGRVVVFPWEKGRQKTKKKEKWKLEKSNEPCF